LKGGEQSVKHWWIYAAVAVVFIVILIVVTVNSAGERKREDRKIYASIVLPDGSIISGECDGYSRNDRYITVYMADKVYKVSDWRVAIWYERSE
jgi:hypothetical protein